MLDSAEAYAALQLKPGATREDVEQAFTRLSDEWRPERFSENWHLKKVAEDKQAQIKSAYDLLVSLLDVPPPPEPPAPVPLPPPPAAGTRAALKPVMTVLAAVATVAALFLIFRFYGAREERPRPKTPDFVELPRPAVPKGAATSADERAEAEGEPYRPPEGAEPQPIRGKPAEAALAPKPRVPRVAKPAATPKESVRTVAVANGQEMSAPRGRPGSGTLRVVNRSGLDAVAFVNSRANGYMARSVYIRAGAEVAIRDLGPDVYTVDFKLGAGWEQAAGRFARNRANVGPFGPFTFVEVQGVDYGDSDHYEIVLKPPATPPAR